MDYEERNKARQAVLIRCRFPSGIKINYPVPLSLSGGPWWKRMFRALRVNAWASSEGDVFHTREQAAYADHMNSPAYKEYWDRRRAASTLVNAKRIVDAADYADPLFLDDRYYDSIEEYLDDRDEGEEAPAWVHGSTSNGFTFDLEDALANYLTDDHHEDAELDHMDELRAFFRAWSEKQTLRTYWEDSKTIVVIDRARFEEELAEAKAILALPAPMRSPYEAR